MPETVETAAEQLRGGTKAEEGLVQWVSGILSC